jgi:hypothetical protein
MQWRTCCEALVGHICRIGYKSRLSQTQAHDRAGDVAFLHAAAQFGFQTMGAR